jgi:hypothetical protein
MSVPRDATRLWFLTPWGPSGPHPTSGVPLGRSSNPSHRLGFNQGEVEPFGGLMLIEP